MARGEVAKDAKRPSQGNKVTATNNTSGGSVRERRRDFLPYRERVKGSSWKSVNRRYGENCYLPDELRERKNSSQTKRRLEE